MAVIFLILFFDKNKNGLLVPGMLLLWFGIFLIVSSHPFSSALPFSVLPACIGAAFISSYLLGTSFLNKWTLYAGVILLFVSAAVKFGLRPEAAMIRRLPAVISAAVIIAGLIIIIRALIKKG